MNNEDIYAAAREEYRKVIVAQADKIASLSKRVEWFTHAVHTCHPECDRPLCKATREGERLRAENANLLAANRDLQDWWSDLRPDHKRLQAENERLRAALVDHNDMLRSAFSAAQRDAIAEVIGTTNYNLVADSCHKVLSKHHVITNQARSALKRESDEG